MPIVSNTSPILNLAIIGHLSLLRKQFGHVIVPQAVLEEFRIDEELPGTKEIAGAIQKGWLSVRSVANQTDALLLERELDKGESEAIALAIELSAELVLIDEREARRVCQSIGIKVTGVLGILAKAQKDGYLPSFEKAVHMLEKEAGFYISDHLMSEFNL